MSDLDAVLIGLCAAMAGGYLVWWALTAFMYGDE